MGKTKLTKDIRTWANEHESLLADMKYLSGARQLANRLYQEFFEDVANERTCLMAQAEELRLAVKLAEEEAERLRGGVTGMLEQQEEAWPIVDGDPLRNLLNYVICIQNNLSMIEDSSNKQYYQKIHDHFQTLIVEINCHILSCTEQLADIADLSGAAASVIDFVED